MEFDVVISDVHLDITVEDTFAEINLTDQTQTTYIQIRTKLAADSEMPKPGDKLRVSFVRTVPLPVVSQ